MGSGEKWDSVLRFRRSDGIAAAAVLLCALALAAALFLPDRGDRAAAVQVYQDGMLVWEQPLSRDGTYSPSVPYEMTIAVEGGRVRVAESACPGRDCVHMGWISRPGRSIVCLPNRVEIRLTGGDGGVDAVVR